MIRFIIIVLMLFLYLLLGIPVLLIEWVIGKYNQVCAWCRLPLS